MCAVPMCYREFYPSAIFYSAHTNVSEDILVNHEVAGHGDQEASHGSVGELAILDGDLWKIGLSLEKTDIFHLLLLAL